MYGTIMPSNWTKLDAQMRTNAGLRKSENLKIDSQLVFSFISFGCESV